MNERVDEPGMSFIEEVVGCVEKKTLNEFVKNFELLFEAVEDVKSESESLFEGKRLNVSTEVSIIIVISLKRVRALSVCPCHWQRGH